MNGIKRRTSKSVDGSSARPSKKISSTRVYADTPIKEQTPSTLIQQETPTRRTKRRRRLSTRGSTSSTASSSARGALQSRGSTASSCVRRKSKSSTQQHSRVASVSVSRKLGEVGLCVIDLSDQSRVVISQVADNLYFSNMLSLLQSHNVTTILIPDTAVQSRLFETLDTAFGSVASIVPVNRKFFNESNGLELLQKHAANAVETDISMKYLALSAFSTLIQWTEHQQHIIFASKGLDVRWREIKGSLMIDHASARHLEIVRNARTGKESKGSLFSVVNFTKTSVGKRMLRSRLLCPPNEATIINGRLDSMEELLQNEDIFYSAQEALSRFSNLEVMISQLSATPKDVSVKTART